MLIELSYKLQILFGGLMPRRLRGRYRNRERKPRGKVLVSYMPLPVIGDAAEFRGHSNVWESSEIVRIFNRLGYSVDLIHWRDTRFVPRGKYAAVFDIHGNLGRYSAPGIRTIFHVTGSNPQFSNRAEEERLTALRERRGVLLAPRRSIVGEDLRIFSENLERADSITLIGNEVTAATFPERLHGKIRPLIATGSYMPVVRDVGSFRGGRSSSGSTGTGQCTRDST